MLGQQRLSAPISQDDQSSAELDATFGKKPNDIDRGIKLQGPRTFRGIPFVFGDESGPDVLALRPGDAPVDITLPATAATYVIFVQVVTDRSPTAPDGFGHIGPATPPNAGNELGELVSTYSLQHADGSEIDVPVLRRFGFLGARVRLERYQQGARA